MITNQRFLDMPKVFIPTPAGELDLKELIPTSTPEQVQENLDTYIASNDGVIGTLNRSKLIMMMGGY